MPSGVYIEFVLVEKSILFFLLQSAASAQPDEPKAFFFSFMYPHDPPVCATLTSHSFEYCAAEGLKIALKHED